MDGRVRLFTGISIASGALHNIERLLAELRPLARVKWSPVENLHITTRFIGEWPEARVEELQEALAGIAPVGPIAIQISGLGFYPEARRPRVCFAGVHADPALPRLAEAISDALATLGLARDDRPYSPHLTLARIKNENMHELIERTTTMSNIQFGSFEAREFHLYLSKATAGGSVYSRLRTYSTC